MKARFLAFAALVLGLASCQSEPEGISAIGSDEVSVVLNVTVPEDITRAGGADSAKGAIGNIDLANDYDVRFILEVYDANGDLAKERFTNYENTATSTAFDLRLVPGRDYRFVVWADFVEQVNVTRDPATNYDLHYNTQDLKNITVNAATWKAMDESRDAYTGYHDAVKFNSTQAINIELKRPFAKLRVVTTDMDDLYNVVPEDVTVTYNTNKLYTTFNAYTSKAIADNAVANRAHVFELSASEYSNDAEGTKTLFADYMFGAENGTVKFTMDVKDTNSGVIPTIVFNTDIPVERNYLTTIIGPVLTDFSNIKVTIDDAFENGTNWNPEDDKYDVEIWDGETVTEPSYDSTTKTYTVKSGAELAWVADQVNGVTRAAANDFSGKTIVLAKNIDLGGHEWTPIGCSGKYFAGTFDGCNHIVGNFHVTTQEGYAALFGNARATIKNLTVIDAKIVSHHYAGGIVGQGYAKINNCHVDNIDITLTTKNGDWGDKAGGIIGQNCEGGLYVTNSSAKNVKIQGYRDLGGIAGMAHNNNTVSGCSVENITILQDISVDYENETPTTLGAVIGRKGSNVTDTDNTIGEEINISIIIAEGLTQDTETDIYTVSSAEGLQSIVEIVEEDGDVNIVLNGDIDLSQLVITRAGVANNWTPIGTEENPFTGTFDGNGNTIKNLALVESEAKEGKAFVGFFGYAKNATIKNVTFENVYINIPCLDIDHSQGHIGAVAGSLEGTSTIEDVTVKGDIQVYATQDANGASRVAVVAGGNSYGNVTMKNVHVIANEGSYLIANNNTGALAGQLQGKSVFEDCSSNINVTVNKFFAGGIIGLAAGDQTFNNCHTTGNIAVVAGREGRNHDQYRVGGIAGGWSDGAKNVCTLTNCSYTGNVSGMNSDGSVANPLDYMGYVGRGYTLNGCKGSKVVIDGMEFVQKYDTATEAGIYDISNLEISDKADMFWFAQMVNSNKCTFAGQTVKLAADINLNNEEWTPIGSAYKDHGFMGNFDGNGKTIKNLKISALTPDSDGFVYAGLFGVTEGVDANNENYIKDLTIENVNISTEGDIVAAAIAYPYYTEVDNVTVKGNVNIKGGNYTAGVLAYTRRCVNAKDIAINANQGSVIEGNSTVGGVISDIQTNGGLTANYSNFEATGLTIKASKCVGGISGIITLQTLNGATVENVTIVSDDARKGIISGALGGKSTITNISYENVTGTENIVGAPYEGTQAQGSMTVEGVEYTYNNGWFVDGYQIIANGLLKKDNEYKVINANGLVALSGITIKGGEVVTLGADIDLNGVVFNGLNAFNPGNNNTFDGKGFTVSNWTNNSGASDMGFIKNWVGPIKNVKFDNCHLKTAGRSAIVAAKVYGNIEKIEVKNSSIEDSYWACGIIAGLYNSGSISDCSVTDSSVKSNGGTAGIVGVINETAGERNLTNCSVTNTTINNTGAYGAVYSGGGLVGMFNTDNSTYKFTNCTVSNNTLLGQHIFEKYPANDSIVE